MRVSKTVDGSAASSVVEASSADVNGEAVPVNLMEVVPL